MSINLTDRNVDEKFTFREAVESSRGPGWYEAECLLCGAETSGNAPVVEEWAYEHYANHGSRVKSEDYIENSFEHYRRMVRENASYLSTITTHARLSGWAEERIAAAISFEASDD